jgi:hypothetical protein
MSPSCREGRTLLSVLGARRGVESAAAATGAGAERRGITVAVGHRVRGRGRSDGRPPASSRSRLEFADETPLGWVGSLPESRRARCLGGCSQTRQASEQKACTTSTRGIRPHAGRRRIGRTHEPRNQPPMRESLPRSCAASGPGVWGRARGAIAVLERHAAKPADLSWPGRPGCPRRSRPPSGRLTCSAWSPARRSSSTTPRRRPAEFTGAVIGRGSAAPSRPPISAPAHEAAPRWSASRYGIEPGRGRGARGGSAPRPRAGPSREARSSPTGRVRRAARRARAPADCAGSGLRRSRASAVSATHAGGGGSRRASGRRVQQGRVVTCASRSSVVAPTRPPRTPRARRPCRLAPAAG